MKPESVVREEQAVMLQQAGTAASTITSDCDVNATQNQKDVNEVDVKEE